MPRFAALFLAALLSPILHGQKLAVSEHTLANGMKLLIHEDHDVPNVAFYLFYTVGSRNERPGTTGLSHFFEHMMFNGATKYGPKQFDIVMEKNGGSNNAYTSRDITAYTNWFPNTAAELMFDMEADRIRDLAIDPKIVESERGVVYSERRLRVDNDNGGLLREQLDAAAFTAHPYNFPVVGWPSDIEGWTMADLKDHFRMGYAPNNCIVVVSGAMRQTEVLRLARKYLEPIPKQQPPPPVRTKEPKQLGERRVSVTKSAQAPMLMVSYHIPESRHADRPALELLNSILSQGRSSRLYRRLVDRDALAVEVQADIEDSIDPGQYVISVQLRPGADLASAEKALHEEVARAVTNTGPILEEEVSKARNQALTSLYRAMRTIAMKANLIGRAQIYYGDWRKINTFADDLGKVTGDDLKRVAAAYLTPSNRTVATLIPAPEAK